MNEIAERGRSAYADELAEPELAPLVTLVGASGGVGCSSIALLMAAMAAQAGIDTALIEADLQFGDYSYWLGIDETAPDLGEGATARPVQIDEHLSLYRAPTYPELAEEVCEQVAEALPRIRAGAGLVIADAGPYWCGLTARLLLDSGVFLMLADPRPSSVYGAVRASELCSRIGVPAARMAGVCNRWIPKAPLSPAEVGRMLGASQVFSIPDGKAPFGRLLSSGDTAGLIASGNPAAKAVRAMLATVLPRVGRVLNEEPKSRGGLFR